LARKPHILVPRNFEAGDVRPDALANFHHMTGSECRILALEGRIEKIGPRIWRLAAEACATAPASETGKGLLSREIEPWLRSIMHAEMRARSDFSRGWSPTSVSSFGDLV
jgi:hypothetical protein